MRLEGSEQECKSWETEFTCLEVEKVATVSEFDFFVLAVFQRNPVGSCPHFFIEDVPQNGKVNSDRCEASISP